MRRSGWLVGVMALAACGALRDAFSAHPEAAGTAAGQTLTVERLADLAGGAKRVPLRPDVLAGLAGMYLDYTVFVVHLARGRDLEDSTLVLAAEWPAVEQMRWERFHDGLVSARAKLTPEQTDSAYRAGDVRLLQHILVRVPPDAAPPVRAFVRQRRLAARARRGGPRGAHALRVPYHPAAAARRGAGLVPGATRGHPHGSPRLALPRHAGAPAPARGRQVRPGAGAPGGAAARDGARRRAHARHLSRRRVPGEGPGALAACPGPERRPRYPDRERRAAHAVREGAGAAGHGAAAGRLGGRAAHSRQLAPGPHGVRLRGD